MITLTISHIYSGNGFVKTSNKPLEQIMTQFNDSYISPTLNEITYQLAFPKPLTRPLLLKQCLPLGSAVQGTDPQLNLPRESVLSGASLCSPQWLRNRGQPAGQPAVVKVSFFHIYILARNDYFIHTFHKNLIKIDTLNLKIGWVFMKIWINNKI